MGVRTSHFLAGRAEKKLQEEKLERSQNVHILSQHFSISLFLILNDRQCGTSLVCFQTANTEVSVLVDI